MPSGARASEVLPGLSTAFDEEAMKGHLEAALFGANPADYVVVRCTPARPLYLPGPSCLLRYRLRARSATSGETVEPIVTARVFPDATTCALYLRSPLAPVAARVRGRRELAALAAPAAAIDALNMVVYVWPVDGELPGLVGATDRVRMLDVFRDTLGSAVEYCEIELVSYRRRQRCVLRYTVAGEGGRAVVYGKVSGVGTQTPKDVVVDELHRRLGDAVTIPRALGWRPELQLSLLEPVPGEPLLGPALAARLRGDPAPGTLTLEAMVAACGRAAAALHGSGLSLGQARTLDGELAGVQRDLAIVRPFVPDAAERAQAWLERVTARAEQSEPLRLSLCHGDFKHEQLLFDGERSALVDFDAVCRAEPALDLGKFLAHLRIEARKLQPSALEDELAEEFLRGYFAARDTREDEPHLRRRTALYEAFWLLHLQLWSLRNLDEAGAEVATALLEERLAVSG